MHSDDKIDLYLCSTGDQVDIRHMDAYYAEYSRVYFTHRDHSDINSNLQPTCFTCRSPLKSDVIDVWCPDINCGGTESGRLRRALELYANYKYGPVSESDVIEEFNNLKDHGVTTLHKILSPLAYGMESLFPIVSSLALSLKKIRNGEIRNVEREQDDLLAVLIEMFAIPGLSAQDAIYIAREASEDRDYDPFGTIWSTLSTAEDLQNCLRMTPREAEKIVGHVYRRRSRRGDMILRWILHGLSEG